MANIYDSSGNIVDVTGTFVKVTDFGATADGVTDDASAIQSAIDSLSETGGIIYFPKGIYLVKSAIFFYSKQTLWFETGATLLQGASINNLLRTKLDSSITGYNGVHDSYVIGGTFDGGSYSENNTLVATGHAKNITFENCTFKNAYGVWHDLEINSSYNVKVINCDFEGSRKTATNGEMLQIDGAGNNAYYPWDSMNMDNTISRYIDIHGCIFHDSSIVPAIGNHSNMGHKYIRIHDCIFDGLTSERGCINFVSDVNNVDIHDNTFVNCTIGIGTSGATYYIHGNRFVSATTAISGSTSVAHANMINGTYTA